VEKIHHTWSFGSDATVLDDYALTTTMTNVTADWLAKLPFRQIYSVMSSAVVA